jgi:hypothetical protein
MMTVEKAVRDLILSVKIFVCDEFPESFKAFSENSTYFLLQQDRQHAYHLAYTKGLDLEPNWPLGFGGCQALIVFDEDCPNNTLPILWKQHKDWSPLFPRH